MAVINQTGSVLFPASVERPSDLNWKATTNGLELAAWSMDDWPLVFCAVYNPTKSPIQYPGGCGLGWWEFTTVFARENGTAKWTEIKIRPDSPFGKRVVTGAGPIPMVLPPGQEFRMSMPSRMGGPLVLPLSDRNFSFCVDLREYSFPEDLSGLIEIRISSLGYEFPETTLPMDTIRKAIESDKQ